MTTDWRHEPVVFYMVLLWLSMSGFKLDMMQFRDLLCALLPTSASLMRHTWLIFVTWRSGSRTVTPSRRIPRRREYLTKGSHDTMSITRLAHKFVTQSLESTYMWVSRLMYHTFRDPNKNIDVIFVFAL